MKSMNCAACWISWNETCARLTIERKGGAPLSPCTTKIEMARNSEQCGPPDRLVSAVSSLSLQLNVAPSTEFETSRGRFYFPSRFWFFAPATALILLAIALRTGLPIYRQQVAIEALERAGAEVYVTFSGPSWFYSFVVKHHLVGFGTVDIVDLEGDRITDTELTLLREFRDLEVLHVWTPHVTEQGMRHLAELKKLRSLYWWGDTFSDAGIARISELTALESVSLHGDKMTDNGIQQLATLSKLKFAEVVSKNVTDSGLERLHEALPGATIYGHGVEHRIKRPGRGMQIRPSVLKFLYW